MYAVYEVLTTLRMSQSTAAKRLGLSPSVVSAYAIKLEREVRAIEPIKAGARPCFYRKGPGAPAFESGIRVSVGHRGGRSRVSLWGTTRVHGDGYYAQLDAATVPEKMDGWEAWEASGSRFWQAWRPYQGKRYYVRISVGADGANVRLNPPEEWVAINAAKHAKKLRLKEANEVLKMLEAEFDLRRIGPLQPKGRIEYAVPDENGVIVETGDPSSLKPHKDWSGPHSSPEVEVKDDPEPLEELNELPATRKRYDSIIKGFLRIADRLSAVEARGAENDAQLRAQVEILARGQEQLARTVGLVEEHHHNGLQNGNPPAPPDNSMEVA